MKKPTLVNHPPKVELPPAPIQLVYPTARLLSAKVRAFVDIATAAADWRFGDVGGE